MLPIVQRLLDGNQAARPERGRAPRVIVLAPTRELAKQVLAALLLSHLVCSRKLSWPRQLALPTAAPGGAACVRACLKAGQC